MANPQWPWLLKDLYRVDLGTTSPMPGIDSEIVRWQKEISRGINNLTDETIREAIQWSADNPSINIQYKPDVRTLRKWIFMMWAERKKERIAEDMAFDGEVVSWWVYDGEDLSTLTRTQSTFSQMKADIDREARRKNWQEVWETICLPESVSFCERLELYAMDRHNFSRDMIQITKMPKVDGVVPDVDLRADPVEDLPVVPPMRIASPADAITSQDEVRETEDAFMAHAIVESEQARQDEIRERMAIVAADMQEQQPEPVEAPDDYEEMPWM